MKISGIYKIQSIVKPERVYIGSATCMRIRWNRHLAHLKKGIHHSRKLQRHYNKYGESDLQFSVLLGCKKEYLIITEQYFLDCYNPYFNTCKIADSTIGCKSSKETREKIRLSLLGNKRRKGIPHSIEVRNKLSDALKGEKSPHFGKKFSEDHCNHLSESHKGHIPWNKNKSNCFSKETLQKMSESHKGKEAWNKDTIGAFSEEAIRKMSIAQMGNKNGLKKTG